MRNKLLLLLCTLLTVSNVKAQSVWRTTRVGDSVRVDFPGQAKLTEQTTAVGKLNNYIYRDSSGAYMVIAKSTPMQAEASAAEVEEFYTGVLKGLGNHIVHKQPVTIRGYVGLQVQYLTPDHPELPAAKYLQVLLVNGTAYVQQVWTDAAQTDALIEKRRRFFASLQPLAPKAAQMPDYVETTSRSYRFGKLLGRVAVIGLLIGGLVGAAFLVSRLFTKRRN